MTNEQMQTKTLSIRRLSHAVGASIKGVDFLRPLAQATVEAILDAWHEHLVLVFPDARLTLEQHVAFTRHFGRLELHPLESLRHPEFPEVFEVTNRMIEGKPSETGEVGRIWHSDGAYTVRPPTASLLHCRALPRAGGTTWFNNMYLAYESLSAGMQRLVNSLEVVNDLLGDGAPTPFVAKRDAGTSARDKAALPEVVQPMVRVHPATGRRALYLNPVVTRRVMDMTVGESRGLLQYLFQHSVKPEFVYCHYWQVDDLVMWDNRCAMHLAPGDYPPSEVRQMYRTTLMGEPHGRYLHESPTRASSHSIS